VGQRGNLRDALAKSQTLVDQQQKLTLTLTGQKLIEAPGESFTIWQRLGLQKKGTEEKETILRGHFTHRWKAN
jgi:hypothetical protein